MLLRAAQSLCVMLHFNKVKYYTKNTKHTKNTCFVFTAGEVLDKKTAEFDQRNSGTLQPTDLQSACLPAGNEHGPQV